MYTPVSYIPLYAHPGRIRRTSHFSLLVFLFSHEIQCKDTVCIIVFLFQISAHRPTVQEDGGDIEFVVCLCLEVVNLVLLLLLLL